MIRVRKLALPFCLLVLLLSACSPPTPADQIGKVEDRLAKLALEGEFSGSVLIAHQGDVLMSEGYSWADIANQILNSAQTRYPIDWLTAPFTSLLIMMLYADGALDVHDPICLYISGCPAYWQGISIHHLLNHTAGVSDWIQPWDQEADRPEDSTGIVDQIKGNPPEFQAGEGFRYCANGYLLLGHIIEEVSGQPYEDFLRERIFEPLRMANTSLEGYDAAKGYNEGQGPVPAMDPLFRFSARGLFSSVEDLYLFDQALFAGELIAQEYLDIIFRGYALTPSIDFERSEYGYGWFVGDLFGRPLLFHGGGMSGYTSMLMRFPEDQLTIIVLRNQGMWIYDGLEKELAGILFDEDG